MTALFIFISDSPKF